MHPTTVDTVSKSKRSWMMSRIRSKSQLDVILHGYLKGWHIKHRMHPKMLASPDALIKPDILIFVDGCFWHSCPMCGRRPKSKLSYWKPKLDANQARDARNTRALRKRGWRVIRVWECRFRNDPHTVLSKLTRLRN